jgi:hypothetical protein
MMRFRTRYFLGTSVFTSFAFILAMAVYIQNYRSDYFSDCDNASSINCESPATIGQFLRYFFIFLYILAGLYFLLVICLFKDQELSIVIFNATAKIITKNLRMLFVPVVIGSIIVGYILYWCYTFGMLFSTPDIIAGAADY